MIDWEKPIEKFDGTPMRFLHRGFTMGSDGDCTFDYWVVPARENSEEEFMVLGEDGADWVGTKFVRNCSDANGDS